MEPNASSPSAQPGPASDAPSALRTAAQWWEPRRVLYNIVLGAVFVALTVRTWPRLRPELTAQALAPLTVLALLANLCYCAAYVVDLAVLSSPETPRRHRWRWALWSAGALFATFFETYWFLDEILPPVL